MQGGRAQLAAGIRGIADFRSLLNGQALQVVTPVQYDQEAERVQETTRREIASSVRREHAHALWRYVHLLAGPQVKFIVLLASQLHLNHAVIDIREFDFDQRAREPHVSNSRRPTLPRAVAGQSQFMWTGVANGLRDLG